MSCVFTDLIVESRHQCTGKRVERALAWLELTQRWQELMGEFTDADAYPDGPSAGDL